MDYKNTLNMPKSGFEMKANLNIKEPKIEQQWLDLEIEQKVYQKNKDLPKFILHDGPPYANGNIHVGHAQNKILKDFIVRYKNMSGYFSKYVAGWDTHGMPIEVELLKKGKNKDSNLTIAEKRNNCKNFAINWIEIQKQQFRRLGIMSAMQEIYCTFDIDYEIYQLKVFYKMLNDGLIYQDLKPIYWSWSSQTALADAEVEYKNIQSNSIFVSFSITESNVLAKDDKLVIWTTTPWTIPSNLAIAVHPELEYVRVKTNQGYYVVSKNNEKLLTEKFNLKVIETVASFKGEVLENSLYIHPLNNKVCPLILANYVSDTDGTGLVHNAPGFGHDDYLTCKKYNIDIYCPIDELGKFTNEVNDEDLIGVFYEQANDIIIEKLSVKNALLAREKFFHNEAHDWRTKKPIIYRATKQWFVNIEKNKKRIISCLDDIIQFNDAKYINRLKEMINNRQEWCISRQRYWGVPIPIIYDENYKPIISQKLQDNILKIFAMYGTDIWFEKDALFFLTEDFDKNKIYYKETDIMDVWFDSGTSYQILKTNKDLHFPADVYLEGKDQYRGWFNSSLINAVAYDNLAPYKKLITHGFVLDGNGLKMSKSLGNIISPIDISNKYGADILRIWVAISDYETDCRISDLIIEQCAEIYRRLRNSIFKFILSNISDFVFDAEQNYNYSKFDKYILTLLQDFQNKAINYYENYDYKNFMKDANKFIIEISSWYFEYIKDNLYCDEKDATTRISCQAVLYQLLDFFIKIFTPIIPHTCEEAYQFINKKNKYPSVQLETMDFINNKNLDVNFKDWENLAKLRKDINYQIEQMKLEKIINKTNEVELILNYDLSFNFSEEELKKYLNVALVKLENLSENFILKKTSFDKCQRCWIYNENITNDVCTRCAAVLNVINS